MDPQLTEDEERFMRWLEEDDVSGHHIGDAPPEWHRLRQTVDSLGELLRANVSASLEPPAAESFNDEVRRRLD